MALETKAEEFKAMDWSAKRAAALAAAAMAVAAAGCGGAGENGQSAAALAKGSAGLGSGGAGQGIRLPGRPWGSAKARQDFAWFKCYDWANGESFEAYFDAAAGVAKVKEGGKVSVVGSAGVSEQWAYALSSSKGGEERIVVERASGKWSRKKGESGPVQTKAVCEEAAPGGTPDF